MIEEWRDINDFEGLYKISNLGRVINSTNEILKQHPNKKGYLCIGLYKDKIRKTNRVHTLVGIHFIENPNNYPTLNHIDGIKTNNYITNLEWNSYSQNMQHAYDNNLKISCKGENHGRSILKEKQVLEIRDKFEQGISMYKLAKEYNVYDTTISFIIKRKHGKIFKT